MSIKTRRFENELTINPLSVQFSKTDFLTS